MTFSHTERKVLRYVDDGVIMPLDLRGVLEDLKKRGHVKTKKVKGSNIPKHYVVKEALDFINTKPAAVDPKRINVNTGTLIDVDE